MPLISRNSQLPTSRSRLNILAQLSEEKQSVGGGGRGRVCITLVKSSIEVTPCRISNILVWFGRDATEKGVAGLTESLISSPFAIAKGLVKYESPNSWA